MDNQIQLFNYEGNDIRTVLIDNDPWFVGNDVASILEYKIPTKAVRDHVDDDDKITKIVNISQIFQNGKIVNQSQSYQSSSIFLNLELINESGLYSLIIGSSLPSAKKFKRWVTSEVLPAIRKNGVYMTDQKAVDLVNNPGNLIDLLQQAADQLRNKDIKIQEMTPKVEYYEECLNSPEVLKTSLVAIDYGLTAQRFNSLLEALDIQYKQGSSKHYDWILKQPYKKNGWMKAHVRNFRNRNTGKPDTKTEIKWTQKGRQGISEKLSEYGIYPRIDCAEQNEKIAIDIITAYKKLHPKKKSA